MAKNSNNLNPISRLLDVDFPDIKRSNWNNSFDVALTSDVGYVKPVFVDRVMGGTRCTLDFNSASFANATIAPLYGRYKVKYLAFWAPDRLYMRDWLSGEKMEDDDYPYWTHNPYLYPTSNYRPSNDDAFNDVTGAGKPYIPPTSLAEYLGVYPSHTNFVYFDENDNIPRKCAFPFLAFWDAYRTFILNPQETQFPVRTRAFTPSLVYETVDDTSTFPALPPVNTFISVDRLDYFFKEIKFSDPDDVERVWRSSFNFNPIAPDKRVYQTNKTPRLNGEPYKDTDAYFAVDYHYGLPLCTYLPDMYTSFISNEKVELERRRSTVVASVNGSQATFTMEQWYLASRIQSKVRKNMYKFQDFSQWIDTNFGIKPPTTLTQPMFLGAFSSDIIFQDAISTVQQGDGGTLEQSSDLGSRAGYGVGRNGDNRNFFDFTAKEPGTVMIVQMIVPEVFYFEGSDKFYEKLNFNEEFNPIFDACGFQDLERADMNLVPNLAFDSNGVFLGSRSSNPNLSGLRTPFSSYNSAVAQQPYGMEHMGRVNRLHGQMTEPSYYQSWSLARSFNYVRGNDSIDTGDVLLGGGYFGAYSTYVIPEMFNNIFRNTQQNIDNFQFYLSFNYRKYQPVSKQFLSFR